MCQPDSTQPGGRRRKRVIAIVGGLLLAFGAVVAKNGTLIQARAGSCTWKHVFFASPGEEAAFGQAWKEYAHQLILEGQAYRIYRTITSGQDVFLSRRVQRSQARDDPNDPGYDAELVRQLREIYGQAYLDEFMNHLELTVEVNEVLSGNLKPGAVLKFRGDNCEEGDLGEPETVFLHVKDARLLWSNSREGETYATVSRKALDWYRSLTPEEIKKLEALRQSRSTGTVRPLAVQ